MKVQVTFKGSIDMEIDDKWKDAYFYESLYHDAGAEGRSLLDEIYNNAVKKDFTTAQIYYINEITEVSSGKKIFES